MIVDPRRIIDNMMSKDRFSQWLGIERIDESEGFCKLRMVIREDMCNGFGIAHGGICYAFADSALAFAANSLGRHALSIDTSISHFKPLKPGAVIVANTRRLSISTKVAHFEVTIENDQQELVAYFKGLVFLKDQLWDVPA